MSIINDMLLDLDARQNADMPKGFEPEGDPKELEEKSSLLKGLIILAVLCSVAFYIFAFGDLFSAKEKLDYSSHSSVDSRKITKELNEYLGNIDSLVPSINEKLGNLSVSVSSYFVANMDVETHDEAVTDSVDKPALVRKTASPSSSVPSPSQKPTLGVSANSSVVVIQKSAQTVDREVANQADMLMRKGRYSAAEKILLDSMSDGELGVLSQQKLVDLYFDSGALMKLESTVYSGVLADQGVQRYGLARFYVASGSNKKAIEVLAKAKPNPLLAEKNMALLAGLYQQEREFSSAEALYNTLVSINPENSTYWLGLGLASESNKRTDRAIYAYRKALTNNLQNKRILDYVNGRIVQLVERRETELATR